LETDIAKRQRITPVIFLPACCKQTDVLQTHNHTQSHTYTLSHTHAHIQKTHIFWLREPGRSRLKVEQRKLSTTQRTRNQTPCTAGHQVAPFGQHKDLAEGCGHFLAAPSCVRAFCVPRASARNESAQRNTNESTHIPGSPQVSMQASRPDEVYLGLSRMLLHFVKAIWGPHPSASVCVCLRLSAFVRCLPVSVSVSVSVSACLSLCLSGSACCLPVSVSRSFPQTSR
jgi:hypothetical protein